MKRARDAFHDSAIYLLWKYLTFARPEKCDRAKIEALQRARLARLLRHTLRHSAFYRQLYRSHGITLDNVETVQLTDLPVLTKQVMMDHFDSLVCDSRLKKAALEAFVTDPRNYGKKFQNRFEVVHSSGSTGTPGIFVYGPRDWATLKTPILTRVTKTRINPFRKQKLAFIGAVDGHYAGISLARAAPSLLFEFLPLDINAPLENTLRALNAFQPDRLSGYASGVGLLAQEQLSGKLHIHPQGILCSADPLTPATRRTIRQAFGVEPLNLYAASESIGIAAQCAAGRNIHLFDDWHCCEILDKDHTPAETGTFGNLVLTNLYNYTQPLIRYRMSDELALDAAACDCGWPFPTLKDVAGRQEDFIWLETADGRREFIHPIVMVEFMVPGLAGMQVVQTARNKLTINAVINGNREATLHAMRERMTQILQKKHLAEIVEVTIKEVVTLRNDPKTGKFKLVIPLKG